MKAATGFILAIIVVVFVTVWLVRPSGHDRHAGFVHGPIDAMAPLEPEPAIETAPLEPEPAIVVKSTQIVSPEPEPIAKRVTPSGCSPALAIFLDRTAKERVTPDLNERIPMVTDADQIAAVVEMLKEATEEDTVRNEAMNLLRRSGYPKLADVLLSILDQAGEKERFRSFIVQHLGHELEVVSDSASKDRISSRLRIALDDAHSSVRRQALMTLADMKDPLAEKLVVSGIEDPAWVGMRDLIIRLQLERGHKESISVIRSLVNDADEATSIAAIHALGVWRDEPSRSALEAAAHADQERTRRAAVAALRSLDGLVAESPLR